MIHSDFHCHTTYADGCHTPAQMVKAALDRGLTTLGVSEHAFTPPDAPDFCMAADQGGAYRAEIAALARQYAGRITLLCGVEMDVDSRDDPTLYDYVIGSVHHLTVNGRTYNVDATPQEAMACIDEGFGGDRYAYAEAYFARVADETAATGAQIVGHFDLLTKFTERGVPFDPDHPTYRKAALAALEKLAAQRLVLEINTGAMARGWRQMPYPDARWLPVWRELGGAVVLTSDAHHLDHLQYGFDVSLHLAQTNGFTTAGFTDRLGRDHRQY